MKRTILALLLFAVVSMGKVWAGELAPINPALLYWQVLANLPKLSDSQAKMLKEMSSGRVPFDAGKCEGMGFGAAEHLVVRAANSAVPCDWGLPYEDGHLMAMPHIPKVMELSGRALLKAESLFADGKLEEAREWLLITHRMARHAGSGGLLIGFLVQASIEQRAIEGAARHCLGWNEATRKGYLQKLKALPPLCSLQEAYQGERIFVDWLERVSKQDEPQRGESLRAIFAESEAGAVGANGKKVLSDEMQALLDPERFRKELGLCREYRGRVEGALGQDWKGAMRTMNAVDEEIQGSGSKFLRMAHPAIFGCAERRFLTGTLWNMLEAALEHGEQLDAARAGAFRDTFEGEPLLLKKTEEGALRLVAAQPHPKGKEIELKLGK